MLTRHNRLGFVAVAALFVVLGAVTLVKQHADRGYTHTSGTHVVHYSLASRLLNQKLAEVAIVPPAGGHWLLVLLHGRHDQNPLSSFVGAKSGPETLLSNQLLQAVAALGPKAPTVVLLNGGSHSYYHDRREGQWGSMILQEAIPDAVKRFGITGKTAIGGISMGGFGALHLAAVAPTRFCAVGVRSAALWTSGSDTPAGAFDDAQDFDRADVFAAARAGRFSRLPVWIDDGTADPFRATDTELAKLLHATFHLWPGAHNDTYWHAHVGAYLGFFARNCS